MYRWPCLTGFRMSDLNPWIHVACGMPTNYSPSDRILLLAGLEDPEGLLGSLDAAEDHGAKGRSYISYQ